MILVCAAILASAPLTGCMVARWKNGGPCLEAAAAQSDVDAIKDHVTTEDNALRSEFQAADAQLRADVAGADAQIRADAQAALAAGKDAYERAVADGKSAIEAERAKWEAAVGVAVKTAADARVVADAAGANATDAQTKARAEAGQREQAFRDLLAALQASKLTPEAVAGLLKDPLAAVTAAVGNIKIPPSDPSNPVKDYGAPAAVALAMLAQVLHGKSRKKDLAAALGPISAKLAVPPPAS
jgi:hypothetical protein